MSTPLERYPALVIFSGWIVSLSLYGTEITPLTAAFLSLLVTLGITLVLTPSTPEGFWAVMALACFVSFTGAFWLHGRIQGGYETSRYGEVHLEGRVLSVRTWGRYRVAILESSGERYLTYLKGIDTFMEGEKLLVEGYTFPVKDAGKDSFNEELYWKARGVDGELVPVKITRVEGRYLWDIHIWRSALRRRIDLRLPEYLRGYTLASWLGIKDPELKADHGRWGTSHLLAVSGFHVGILAGLLWLIFPRGRISTIIISLFLWLYVSLAGFSPSAVRAALMLQMILLGELLYKPLNSINSVSVACMVMLLLNPWIFWDLGWRLSASAAMTIAAFSGMKLCPRWALILSPLIWVTTSPIVTGAFDSIPLAGLFINLFAIPFFAFLFPLLALLSLMHLFNFPLVLMIELPVKSLLMTWRTVCDLICRLFPWHLSWHPILVLLSVSVLTVMILKSGEVSWRRGTLVIMAVNIAVSFLSFSVVV